MEHFRPHLRSLGVTEQQWRILRALDGLGECSASDLAEATCISMPSLSRIIAGLDERELVTRRADESDLRRTFIALGPEGEALLRQGAEESERIYAEIAGRLGPKQVEALYVLLDDIATLDLDTDND